MRRHTFITLMVCFGVSSAQAQTSFVNWETPQVHPLEQTPDGLLLLAANTADNRVEVYAITKDGLNHLGAVPVGLTR